MGPLLLAALLLLPLLTLSVFRYSNGGKTPPLPPGPRGLPILGYLPFLSNTNNMLQHLTKLSHKFGPIYKLQLGSKLAVVITSPSLIKQVVRDHDSIFANRDVTAATYAVSRCATDLVFSPPNSRWRAMRKVFVEETQSRKGLEASYALRKEMMGKAIRYVYSMKGERVGFRELTFRTGFSALTNLLWGGVDFRESEGLGEEFRVVSSKITDLLGKFNVSDLFPVVARFDLQGVERGMVKLVECVDKILDAFISQHEKMRAVKMKEGRKDFVQILLELMEKKQDSELGSLSRDQLKSLLTDIIIGGSDTTSATVEFAMAELLNRPEAMEKVQKEVSEVVGMNNIVEEFHLPKLHYLKAVMKETFRLHPPVPFLVPRSPHETSTIGGYKIPKETRILLNIWAVQRDPSIWDCPEEFKPDRFLQDNGNLDFKGNNFHFLPFGSGRRMCPGMPLGETMVAYLLASFLHSFDWKLPNAEKIDMSETVGIGLVKTNPLFAIPTPRLPDTNLYD